MGKEKINRQQECENIRAFENRCAKIVAATAVTEMAEKEIYDSCTRETSCEEVSFRANSRKKAINKLIRLIDSLEYDNEIIIYALVRCKGPRVYYSSHSIVPPRFSLADESVPPVRDDDRMILEPQ
jgi:hypothetical protein